MKVAQLFENSPNFDQLYNNQNAQCYLFAIFFVKMAKKYKPSLSLSFLSLSWWSSSSLSWWSSLWLSSWSSSWPLTAKEKAKYELLYNRMIAAKKRYEDAGGKVDRTDRYVR